MPAGDAGRPYGTPAEENAWDVANELRTENGRLCAQLAAIQSQLVARGPYCALHGEHQPCSQHRWVDAAQAAQPEGERG